MKLEQNRFHYTLPCRLSVFGEILVESILYDIHVLHTLAYSKECVTEKIIILYLNQNICCLFVCLFLFDLILYVPSTIFQLNRDGSSRVEPVLS